MATGALQGNRKLLNQIAKWNLAIKCLAVAITAYFKYSDIMSYNSSLTQDLCLCRFVNFYVLGIGIRTHHATPNCNHAKANL